MFDRFTERARKTMMLARQEAQRLNHDYIGTEHILLGLVAGGDSVGTATLKALGVRPEQVRSAVQAAASPGRKPATLGQLPFTPGSKTVLEDALEEAQGLGHSYIGTEHLLLGLVRDGHGIAGDVLAGLGVSRDAARAQVVELSGGESPGADPATAQERRRVIPAVLRRAREQATSLRHDFVGTEHMLLAVASDAGPAAEVLASAGATPEALRVAVARIRGGGTGAADRGPHAYPFTPSAHAAVGRIDAATHELDRFPLGPEHVLLALLDVPEGIALAVLRSLAIDPAHLRAELVRRVRGT
jgi:ATP-dependent Clp protease ATP-binding subunit ClpA